MPQESATKSPLRATHLRTERRIDPLGIDEPAPVLGWWVEGDGRGRAQTAYRIRVTTGTDPADEQSAAVWDTGTVASNETVDVTYAGVELTPTTTYRWAVRVTDEDGAVSPWAAPATFETGLGAGAAWGASWIGAPVDTSAVTRPGPDDRPGLGRAARIWLPSGDPERDATGTLAPLDSALTAGFRASITIPAGHRLVDARLLAVGAGDVRVWCNGTEVAADSTDPADAARLVGALGIGANTVAVRASAGAGSTPALLIQLRVYSDRAEPSLLDGAAAWRAAADPQGEWWLPGYDDSAWPLAARCGFHGDPPIGREPASYRPIPYLRKEITLDQPVTRARLYSTALGVYEVRVNGTALGRDEEAPGWTDYDYRIPYQTYDVTGALDAGPNVVAARVSDGWYAGQVSSFGRAQWGDAPLFLARLDVTYADGSTERFGTGADWRCGNGGIRYADLIGGEVIDARLEPAGWDRPGFAADWPVAARALPRAGRLEGQTAPPVAVEHEIPAVRVSRLPGDRFLVDFGQNLVGAVRLRAAGPAGTHLVLCHAEVLDADGELYLEALRGADAVDEFFLAGAGEETFAPRFTQHGFRFVEVSGYPGELSADRIDALVVHAEMDPIGEFSCSDDRINALQHNIVWCQRGNFLTVPTDCPQRDERLGWTGDAQVFGATAAFNYDVRTFFRKWLRDLRDAQLDNGAVTHFAPNPPGQRGDRDQGAAGWGDVIAILPAQLLQAYADRRAVAETLPAIKEWVDFCEGTTDGLIRPDWGFADWLAMIATPKNLVATAFFAYSAKVGADLARGSGEAELAAELDRRYQEIRDAFRARFVRGGGRMIASTQTAYVLALHFGLLEPDEEPAAAAALVADVKSRNWHLSTGFLGTPYLLDVLTRTGHLDVAYRLLTQDTFPSWLYPVVHGDATTIWERWDSWSDSRGFQDPGMTSFNHYAYGAVGDWIYRTVGGLCAAAPGYAEIGVAPRPGGDITSARTALQTPHGPVEVEWSGDADDFRLAVSVPANTVAHVALPPGIPGSITEGGVPLESADGVRARSDGVLTVGSGTYVFLARTA
ncbi:MAG: family 78 glycoside hydrolase catalytic domain [Mycobacteriales bacterium]